MLRVQRFRTHIESSIFKHISKLHNFFASSHRKYTGNILLGSQEDMFSGNIVAESMALLIYPLER
jgi:hypothetical protein